MNRTGALWKSLRILLVFFLLELIVFGIIVRRSNLHKWIIENISLEISGSFAKIKGTITDYLYLKEINKRLMDENAYLYSFLGRRKTAYEGDKNQYVIPARILNIRTSGARGYFVIDAGSNLGIRPDLPVISGGALVGKTEYVSPHFSICLSLFNVDLIGGVRILPSNAPGIMKWSATKHNEVDIIEVPSFFKIEVGDTVITAGGDGFFPWGIPIGTISQIDTTIFLTYNLKMTPLVNVYELTHCFVIADTTQKEIIHLKNTMINE